MGLESSTLAGQAFFNDAVTTVIQVKGTAGSLLTLKLLNTTAAAAYLQVFFAPAASVTLGTTAPDFVVRMAASESGAPISLPPGFGLFSGVTSKPGTGLTVAGTTTPTGSTGAALSVSAAFA